MLGKNKKIGAGIPLRRNDDEQEWRQQENIRSHSYIGHKILLVNLLSGASRELYFLDSYLHAKDCSFRSGQVSSILTFVLNFLPSMTPFMHQR